MSLHRLPLDHRERRDRRANDATRDGRRRRRHEGRGSPGGTSARSVVRVEDERLLTGQGRFVADIDVPGMLHAAFLRSPHPHALIKRIDVTAARALPGCVCRSPERCSKARTNPLLSLLAFDGLYTPYFWALATDRVRSVGDPVALVLAPSRYLAEDAMALIEVDYEPLEAVATIDQALDPAQAEVVGQGRRQHDVQLDTAVRRRRRRVRGRRSRRSPAPSTATATRTSQWKPEAVSPRSIR